MLVTAIKGNIHESPLPEGIHVETVRLPGEQLVKRVQRVRTDHDREIGIRLPPDAPELRDGDLLHLDEGHAIIVRTLPTDVLVIRPRSLVEMGTVAHALGNRHLPAQFFAATSEYGADVMVVPDDHTVVHYLESAGVPYAREKRVLPRPFRHSEHTH